MDISNETTVFNFYEQITPPATFSTFVEGWRHFGKYTETLDHYLGAKLYKNLDPKGRFPFMNIAKFIGPRERILKDMTTPGPELIKALVEGHGLPGHQINHPGAYTKIVTDNNNDHSDTTSSQVGTVMFVSAYEGNDTVNLEVFEENWAEETGYNIISDFIMSKNGKVGKHGVNIRYTPYEPFHTPLYVFYCELPGFIGDEEDLVLLAEKLKELPLAPGFKLYDSSIYCLDQVSIGQKYIN